MISIASIPAPDINIYSILNEGNVTHLFDALLIRLLSQIFRTPFKILVPSDGENGRKLPNGNWTGLIGMLLRSEVDLSMSIQVSYSRYQAVNMSYPLRFSNYAFMTDKPKPVPTNLAIVYPFPLILWILLAAVILLFSYTLYFLADRKRTYQNILFMLFGSLLEKSIDMKLRKVCLKLAVGTWLIFSFVIINSYKAVLLSILTVPPLTGIKSISDLARAAEEDSFSCYKYKYSVADLYFLESNIETWRPIGKCLQRKMMELISKREKKVFQKDPSKKAFIASRLYLNPYKEKYFIPDDSFWSTSEAFYFSKNFCCSNYLNEVIHRLFAAGLIQKIDEDEQFFIRLKNSLFDSNESNKPKALHFEDIKGAFTILVFGYTLSTIVFFVEIVIKYDFLQLYKCFFKRRRKHFRKM